MSPIINTYRTFLGRVATWIILALAVLALPAWLVAGTVTLPYAFQNGQIADANQINANFGALKSAVDANSAQIGLLGGVSPVLKPRVAILNDQNAFQASAFQACSSDQDCAANQVCTSLVGSSRSCADVKDLVDYEGSGYLLSVRAWAGAVNTRVPGAFYIAIDDDAPQRFPEEGEGDLQNIEEWLLPQGAGTVFGIPLGTLRFTKRLHIFVLPNCSPGGYCEPNAAVTYAIE